MSLVVTAIVYSDASSVSCENVGDKWIDRSSYAGYRKTCFMNDTTAISATGSSFTRTPRDPSIIRVSFDRNSKIEYLPESGWESLPSLKVLTAWHCSIQEISRKNFKNMRGLVWLGLYENKIRKINSDTFLDLPNLEWLDIPLNFISTIGINAFNSLQKLEVLWLFKNECIDRDFNNSTDFALLPAIITQNCTGSFEISDEIDETQKLKTQISALHLLVNQKQADYEKLSRECRQKDVLITEKNEQIKAFLEKLQN